MATQFSGQFSLPIPPTSKNDVEGLHRWAKDTYNVLSNVLGAGVQGTNFTNSQVNAMVTDNDLTQSGKMIYETDTHKLVALVATGGTTLTRVELT